eukprot:6184188-Pleurochrysis_carterae.AAC.1
MSHAYPFRTVTDTDAIPVQRIRTIVGFRPSFVCCTDVSFGLFADLRSHTRVCDTGDRPDDGQRRRLVTVAADTRTRVGPRTRFNTSSVEKSRRGTGPSPNVFLMPSLKPIVTGGTTCGCH